MTPDEAARSLQAELGEALASSAETSAAARIEAVTPPPDLGPDREFLIDAVRSDGERLRFRLPASLVAAYLADEEAAVDEWRRRVERFTRRIRGAEGSG